MPLPWRDWPSPEGRPDRPGGSISRLPQAVSPFRLDKFEPQPPYAEDDGVTYGRDLISKTFTGDLEGNQPGRDAGGAS